MKSVIKLYSGSLLIEVTTQAYVELVMKLETLAGIPVAAMPYILRFMSRGVMSVYCVLGPKCPDQFDISAEVSLTTSALVLKYPLTSDSFEWRQVGPIQRAFP